MMFMNLHTLPIGQAMFTVFITTDPQGDVQTCEEIDLVLPDWYDAAQVKHHVAAEIRRDYQKGTRVIGVSNQSRGAFIWYEEGLNPRV